MTDQNEQGVELTNETEEALAEKMGHDPKNAEAQSIAATSAAGNAGPSAKEPGGAGGKAEPMQKLTKAGMMNQMISAMKKMKKADMVKIHAGMYGEAVELEDDEVINSNHDEDLDVLIKSEESLSEGFKERAAVIFEAAVNSKVKEAVKTKEDEIESELAERVEALEEQLNQSTEKAMTMKEDADKLRRAIVIKNASKDLADTQVAKLEELAEGIDFEDEETFTKKIDTLKGSYFSETPEKAVEAQAAEKIDEATEDEGQAPVEVSSNMEKYLTAIRQNS